MIPFSMVHVNNSSPSFFLFQLWIFDAITSGTGWQTWNFWASVVISLTCTQPSLSPLRTVSPASNQIVFTNLNNGKCRKECADTQSGNLHVAL